VLVQLSQAADGRNNLDGNQEQDHDRDQDQDQDQDQHGCDQGDDQDLYRDS